MGHWITQHLSPWINQYGYWAIFGVIMLESAGLPLPGETILILASLAAGTSHHLHIVDIAIVGAVAAITGDNLGFAAGKYGGCPLLTRYSHVFHIKKATIQKGERLFHDHGGVAVFLARFIAGLRVLAGPLAGTLKMGWRKFMVFNTLGAVAWVTVICTLAYLLGPSIEVILKRATWPMVAVTVLAIGLYWWRHRHSEQEEEDETEKAA